MADYYHRHSQSFFDRTFSVDPSSFLSPFVRALPEGAAILDVGCGSGRDLLWMKDRGFAPTGFEKSPGLAALARKHSGCEVIEGDFETFDFAALSFDAILASGAFVHVPHARLAHVIENVARALSPGGWFYISLKKDEAVKSRILRFRHSGGGRNLLQTKLVIESGFHRSDELRTFCGFIKKGEGTKTDDTGRVFYLWQDAQLRTIFKNLRFAVTDFSSRESVMNSKDVWLGYVLSSLGNPQCPPLRATPLNFLFRGGSSTKFPPSGGPGGCTRSAR